MPKKYTNKELLQIIRDKAEELGRRPAQIDIRHAETIRHRFGYWNKALELAGFEPFQIKKYSDEDLLQIIKDKAEELGRSPTLKEINQRTTIYNRFGGMKKALELAGLKIDFEKGKKVVETNDELLELYNNFSILIGKELEGATSTELDEADEIYDSSVYTLRFGNLNNVRKLLGMEIKRQLRSKYDKEDVLNNLKKIGRLKNNEIEKHPHLPSKTTILRLFKTTNMTDVWKEVFDE